MKKIIIICAALLCGTILQVCAQGTQFRELTFRQALEKAKQENKPLFLDCYTSWCGPCKNMLNNVFTLPEAGEFMNTSFVCVKFDMEKGEGVELQKQFNVRAFPTFLIIRPDGTIQHRLAGGSQWPRFKQRLERGLNEKTSLHYLDNLYRAGKLSSKQHAAYVLALNDASEDKQVQAFCREVFGKLTDKAKAGKDNWFLYEQEMLPTDQRFVYLLNNKPLFDRNIGKEIVDSQLYSVYSNTLNLLHSTKTDNWVEICGAIGSQLQQVEFDQKDKINALLNYVTAIYSRNIEGVLQSLEQHWNVLPAYIAFDCLGSLNFIATQGDKSQLARYISIVEKAQSQAENPNLNKLLGEMLTRYRGELTDRTAYAEVKGKVTKDKMKQVNLYQIVDGQERLLATSQVGKDGLYGFAFQPPYSGFYSIGGEKKLDKIRLYLKPGDRGEVNIAEDTLVITGRNTPENLLLARWEAMMTPVRERLDGIDYVLFDYRDFFPYFMNFLPQAEAFRNGISFPDETFAQLMRRTISFDLDYAAFCIINALKATKELHNVDGRPTHIPSRPTPADYPEYYKTIVSKEKLADASILEQPYGYDYLQRYTTFAVGGQQAKSTLADRLAWLPCDLLKAEMVLWQAERCRTYEDYLRILADYGQYLTTTNHAERKGAVSAKLYVGTKGKQAADFTYPDRNGKMVSLSDFRGKVVLVDVWATWCGPCRAEIPHLVKLEKEMQGKDVVFISVSVDDKKDHQKWLDVLDSEGMHGVQLFAGGWGQIVKDYKIKGIPRFMVFDRNGNVVTTQSPRPSNPELKKLLEKML